MTRLAWFMKTLIINKNNELIDYDAPQDRHFWPKTVTSNGGNTPIKYSMFKFLMFGKLKVINF